MFLIAVYRSPSFGVPAFLRDLPQCLASLPSFSFVVGDINIDLNTQNNPENFVFNYCDILSKYGYFNTIHSPTRVGDSKSSILDHILTNQPRKKFRTCTVDSDISDHFPICIAFQLYTQTKALLDSAQATYTKTNFKQLHENLESKDWSVVYNETEPNQAFDTFITNFQATISESSKVCQVKRHKSRVASFKKPWMSDELNALSRKRKKLHDNCKLQPFNTKLHEQYRAFRNFVSAKIAETRNAHFKTEFTNCKDNQVRRWRFIKKVLNRNEKTENCDIRLKSENDTLLENPLQVSEAFNEYFTTIGSNLANQLPRPLTTFDSYFDRDSLFTSTRFDFYEIETHDILPVIDSLDVKKATGFDNIPARAIKENKIIIAPILMFLINLIIQTSVFPDCLKIARVTPIFKKGEKTNRNNYRPISILSAISKIVEKVLTNQLSDFMELHDLFTESQHGFRKGRNTTGAINNLMEQLYENFNSSAITQGVFLDFSKAFDTINHQILIDKLPFYGLTFRATRVLESYLQNRKQFVMVNGHVSDMRKISVGVPQGSILGPLLFLIYINDLLKAAPILSYILYADDTNIFSTDPKILQNEIINIENWCIANKLVLNYSKTFQVIFKAPNKRFNSPDYIVNLSNTTLELKNETKFLGITLDSNITFKQHLVLLCQKLNLILFMMKAVRPYFDQKTMIELYYAFFYPHILYGIEFWGHACDCDIKHLVVLQKASVRTILNIKPRDHVTSYFKDLKIMPIKMLFEYSTLKLLLKTFSQEFLSTLVSKNNYNTRYNGLKPKKANNKRGERSLLNTGVNLYNKYLLGGETRTVARPWDGLAALMWGST